MKSINLGGCVVARELKRQKAEGCLTMCGMCPSCVFAPEPPGSTHCLWKASDKFKRRFVVKLILRCTSTQVLQSIQSALGVTSCTLFTYARSRSPCSPQDYPGRSADPELDAKPLDSDVNEIWDWFARSPNWIKSRYLIHLLSRCDLEMLRMVANLTSVLLVRQKRGFLQFHGKGTQTKGPMTNSFVFRNVSAILLPQQIPNLIFQRVAMQFPLGDSDDDTEDPALMLVPGSSKSLSGVSQYRDLIGCLPVDLSKRILGLLDEHALKCCQKVCQHWQHLAQETMEEDSHSVDENIMNCLDGTISPTYANFVEVPVPVKDDENGDILSLISQVKPFEAAYAKVQTKTVQMEERNVYCSAYFTSVLEDPNRVVDYTGGSLMAMGSKDCKVHLVHVTSKMKIFTVMKGHVGSIRAVLLCEDRDLVITASCDANIRCWNLKTDRCVMKLYGHKRTVTCLDVHADRLVSGAKDWRVYVWSLHTGKHFKEFNFKHHSAVQCVRINTTTVYSSCDVGLVKVWDMGSASLLRVIDAHRTAVKCLFVDKWHILSGDTAGHVKAWSVGRDAKQCLMTFSHPREVKSLTVLYLRVVTGCADGKIRVFNFLTGDCLRDIVAETEPVIMSERATSERIKRRGLHHPLTPDFMLLRLNAIQKAHSMDEVGINMERNARLRDSWGPGTAQGPLQFGPELQALKHSPRAHRYPEGQPTRAQTCIPILKKSYQPRYNKYNGRQNISSQR
uniref:Uncharacterized protein n=1 Tax=Mola mola TaxID=94237 RepID=A0A3Q4BYG8_MOLML